MPPRFLGLNAHLRLIHPDHETIGRRLCNVQCGFPHPTTRIEYQRWKTAFRPLVSQFIKGKLVVQSDRFLERMSGVSGDDFAQIGMDAGLLSVDAAGCSR